MALIIRAEILTFRLYSLIYGPWISQSGIFGSAPNPNASFCRCTWQDFRRGKQRHHQKKQQVGRYVQIEIDQAVN
jgi:hypothetical protein